MDQELLQQIRARIALLGAEAIDAARKGDNPEGATALVGPMSVQRIVRQEAAERIRRDGTYFVALLLEAGVIALDMDRVGALLDQAPLGLLTESPPCQHFARPHVEPPPPVPPEGCVETVTAPRRERPSAVAAVAAKLAAASAVPPLYAEEAGPAHVGFVGQFSAQIRTPEPMSVRVAEVVADTDGRSSHAWTINKLARQMAAAPELVALLGAVLPYARSRLEAIEEDAMADLDAPHDVGAKAEEAARKARAAIGAADRLLERIHAPTHPADLKL